MLGQAARPVYEMMRDEFGLTLPFDDWIRRKYDHYLAHAPALKPRPGAIEIFRDLQRKGVVQAVVSNSDRLIVDANLRAVGIVEPGMKTVSAATMCARASRIAEPFLRAAWLTGIDPADTRRDGGQLHRRAGRACRRA